ELVEDVEHDARPGMGLVRRLHVGATIEVELVAERVVGELLVSSGIGGHLAGAGDSGNGHCDLPHRGEGVEADPALRPGEVYRTGRRSRTGTTGWLPETCCGSRPRLSADQAHQGRGSWRAL